MRAEAIYGALLRCYPLAFRDEYGEQMQMAFAEQLDDAKRSGPPLAAASIWLQAASDAVTIAPREHYHMILHDLRYALRTMMARPGFTVVAVVSLALGIGANTAIFSLWNAVLRAPLPGVRQPEELVMLTNPTESGMWRGRWTGRTDGARAWLTYAEFEQMRDRVDAFAGIMASQSNIPLWRVRVDGAAGEDVRGRMVSGAFFQLLGVEPLVGRLFTPDADRSDAPDVVISHAYWQRRFGGASDIAGKTIHIRNTAFTIIGVTPRGFVGETSAQQPDLWMPLRSQPILIPGNNYLRDMPPDKAMWLHVFARLKPGVTRAQAEAQANAVLQAGLIDFYGPAATGEGREEFLDQRLEIRPAGRGASPTRPEFSASLTMLLAGVGILLLIACANLANLLLARGASRKTEMALRLSLGAGRGRLMRQLITESLVIAVLGGIAAIVVAYLLHATLVVMLTRTDAAFRMTFGLDPVVVLFLGGVTFAAALLFGLLPAWQATSTDAAAGLMEHGRGQAGSRAQIRAGRMLVTLQLAMSLPLLVGAGLLARTAYNLTTLDLGFPRTNLMVARVDLRTAVEDPLRRMAVRQDVLERLRRVPGVSAVSFSQLGIFTGQFSTRAIAVDGYVRKQNTPAEVTVDPVGAHYFATLGVPIVLGRDISESDRRESPPVCVINEALADEYFPNRNPVGLTLTVVDDDRRSNFEVVGVARNARTYELRGKVQLRFFTAANQQPNDAASPIFLVRSNAGVPLAPSAVRQAIEGLGELPVTSVQTVEQRMTPLTAQDQMTAQIAVMFGGVALALAAIGLYGVLSYGVARRTGEIAVRIALGAQPARVIAMILAETGTVVIAGLALGAGLAFGASRLLGSRLYGVAPQDPLTFGGATALLLTVALVAAYVPARRASKLEPIAALRSN